MLAAETDAITKCRTFHGADEIIGKNTVTYNESSRPLRRNMQSIDLVLNLLLNLNFLVGLQHYHLQ